MAGFQGKVGFIWSVADEILRDDFKRSKYPDVILPFTVLRRVDCVLEPTKDKVLEQYESLKDRLDKLEGRLTRVSGHFFFNVSPFTFSRLLEDPQNVGKNLRAYVNGFSDDMREVLDRFKIRNTIDQLEEKGLLYQTVQKFASINLHPHAVPNHEMGTIFEELLRKFNEQTNENPGEHFTPREVIKLMVRLVLNGDAEILEKEGVVRSVYDPACGTGGMLSIAEDYVRERINPTAGIRLYGQEINDETYAVCVSDMLIKGDEDDAKNIKSRSSLSQDGHRGATFDYMLSNPPFGKDWKKERVFIEEEAERGVAGRFGAGLPRTSDGQLLFLQHMISKMKRPEDGGSRIAIVLNGSPLFTGGAGGGESEIRRWILENDWLETIVSLPTQLFYNTGIATYVWILSNRKDPERRGKVMLVNGAATEKAGGKEAEVFARKMRKSLGDKRNELGEDHIDRLVELATSFEENEYAGIFDSTDFGYRRITVERSLRLNFQASPERIARLHDEKTFQNLAVSKKKGMAGEIEAEAGKSQQAAILDALKGLYPERLYRDRREFERDLDSALKAAGVKLGAPVKKAILSSLSERDPEAEVCTDRRGNPEPDPELRDAENVPLSEDIHDYFEREVLPHVPDAWIDENVRDPKDGGIGKVGDEINFNRYFNRYEAPRPLEEIDAEIKSVEAEILEMLREVTT